MHWRLLVPTKYLCAADLREKDRTVIVERVEIGEMTEIDKRTKKRRKTKKGLVYFKGKEKALCLNATNAQTIVDLYGPKTDAWIGKPIVLYPTTCSAFGKSNVECIRIRDKAPKGSRGQKQPITAPEHDMEPDLDAEIADIEERIATGKLTDELKARIQKLPDAEAVRLGAEFDAVAGEEAGVEA